MIDDIFDLKMKLELRFTRFVVKISEIQVRYFSESWDISLYFKNRKCHRTFCILRIWESCRSKENQCLTSHIRSSASTMIMLFPRITWNKSNWNIVTHRNSRSWISTYHHSNIVLLAILANLHGFIDDHIHERIEATQDSLHWSTSIEFQWQLFVHISENSDN